MDKVSASAAVANATSAGNVLEQSFGLLRTASGRALKAVKDNPRTAVGAGAAVSVPSFGVGYWMRGRAADAEEKKLNEKIKVLEAQVNDLIDRLDKVEGERIILNGENMRILIKYIGTLEATNDRRIEIIDRLTKSAEKLSLEELDEIEERTLEAAHKIIRKWNE